MATTASKATSAARKAAVSAHKSAPPAPKGIKAPPSTAYKIIDIPETYRDVIQRYAVPGTFVSADEKDSPWVPFGTNAAIRHLAFDVRHNIFSNILWIKSKGVVVSDCCSTDPVAAPFIYNTSTPPQAAVAGKYLAAEVVADSHGKANTLYVNIPAYTILGSLGSTFESSYKQYCSTCSFDSIDVSLTQLPQASNLIVSLTFLTLLEKLGPSSTFALYALFSVASWLFSYYLVPETKGRTLEQIEEFWRKA